jgi:hypothetical protein
MAKSDPQPTILPPMNIAETIHILRGQRVMLDMDLARLYGVETRALNQAVRRNPERFPEDFMFQLTDDEWKALRSQSVTSKEGVGGRRYLPHAFTQEGVAMLSGVLHSSQAITVNVEIMRAFVRLRSFLASQAELSEKLKDLELRFENKAALHDTQLRMLVEAMRQLREEVRKQNLLPHPPPTKPKRRIGFHQDEEDSTKGKAKEPGKRAKHK